MSLKGTIVAGLAALMLSSSMADAQLEDTIRSHIGKPLQLGTKDCVRRAEKGDVVAVHLKLKIDAESPVGMKGFQVGDSRSAEQGKPHVFMLGQPGAILPALDKALEGVCGGESLRVRIPSRDAYGKKGMGIIPGGADVEFEVDVLSVTSHEEVKKREEKEGMCQAAADDEIEVVYRNAAHNELDCDRNDRFCTPTELKPGDYPKPPRKQKVIHIARDFSQSAAENSMFEDKKIYPINYFETLDMNQDGWVSEDEYKGFVKKVGLQWSFWKIVFMGDDVDKDGRLSWEEFGSPKGVQPPGYIKNNRK